VITVTVVQLLGNDGDADGCGNSSNDVVMVTVVWTFITSATVNSNSRNTTAFYQPC